MTGALSLRVRAGYGSGDAALNLLWSTTSFYLLIYYTDILGIAPALAGAIILGGLLWDGLTDPVMGIIAERTRTVWGRYRPYLLLACVPLGLSFILMFAAPVWFHAAETIAVIVTHLLFRTLYTVVAIPYSALSARITLNSTGRGRLSAARMIFATLGALFVARCTLELAAVFGGDDLRAGFIQVAALYGVAASAILLITFLCTREQEEGGRSAPPRVTAAFGAVAGNWPALLLLAAILSYSLATNFFTKSIIYLLTYGYQATPKSIGEALAIFVLSASLAIPFWSWVSEATSKRSVWLAGCGVHVFALSGLYLASPASLAGVFVAMSAYGVGAAAFILSIWSMLPDTVEFGEWRSRVRTESLVFGLAAFVQKVGLGVGVGAVGLALDAIGYQANASQSGETLANLRVLILAGPLTFTALAAALVYFYPIDRAFHERLRAEIGSRAS